MPKLLKTSAALLFALFAFFFYASAPAPRVVCAGFLPPNDMKIPEGDVRALGLDKGNFNKVLDRVQKVYGPIVAAHGGRLVINRLWKDPTVNASAEQQNGKWILNMYGGLARYKGIDYNGFALVACHELGHHLGGYPRYQGDPWASNEGEADYHATLKCLRRVLGTTAANADPVAQKRCAKVFKTPDDVARCELGTMAGMSVAGVLADLGGSPTPKLGDQDLDPSQVAQTDDEHPAAQCRMDTMFEGALCAKPVSEDLSSADPNPGACTEPQGFREGLRPRCWYKPPALILPTLAASRLKPQKVAAMRKRLDGLKAAFEDGRGFE